MSAPPHVPVEPPWSGWIATTGDTLLILEAARRGLIPRVARRMTMTTKTRMQRKMQRGGEEHKGRTRSGASLQPLYTSSKALSRPSLTNNYKFKANGLMKKTFSVTLPAGGGDGTQHLVSYYSPADVTAGCLHAASSLPELATLEIAEGLLDRDNPRVPAHISALPHIFPAPLEPKDKHRAETVTRTTTCTLLCVETPRSIWAGAAESCAWLTRAWLLGVSRETILDSVTRPSSGARGRAQSPTSSLPVRPSGRCPLLAFGAGRLFTLLILYNEHLRPRVTQTPSARHIPSRLWITTTRLSQLRRLSGLPPPPSPPIPGIPESMIGVPVDGSTVSKRRWPEKLGASGWEMGR
ncbi:hypothetical protein FB45DRAFT_882439 [Roridomyces roridus]|uniref:Uncharacterized protein n=1 Tax=Roridomyces roridus TaxID=1738132 RepID=A0AAD7AXP1_9AGAR|nr:hypothetical protein FB45DRAFT_882439 [Roridomyces roridus]